MPDVLEERKEVGLWPHSIFFNGKPLLEQDGIAVLKATHLLENIYGKRSMEVAKFCAYFGERVSSPQYQKEI